MKNDPTSAAGPLALLARLAMIGACLSALSVAGVLFYYGACLTVPLACIVIVARLLPRKSASTTFGSARYATRRDLEAAGMLRSKGLVLGRPTPVRPPLWRSLKALFTAPLGRPGVCRQVVAAFLGAGWAPPAPLIRLSRFTHLMAVSPTGGGKGVSLVIPSLLTWGDGSVVVIDPKGENYSLTSQARRNMGQAVYRIDPFSVCGRGGARFNPLDTIDIRSHRALNDCLALAEALVVRGAQETDPCWSDNATTCLQGFIFYVACFGKPEERNLLTVRELITDEDAFLGTLLDMRQSDVAGGALRRLGGQMSRWQDRELASIVSATNRHLAFLDSPIVSDSISSSDFDPADLVRRRMSAYLILPPDQLQPLSRLMRLWLSSFMRRLSQGKLQEQNLVLFVLDEVGNLGPMPVLKEALTVLRGYGIRLYFFLQALGQLQSLFPDKKDYQTVQASIDTQIYMGVRDRETAEEVSACLGDQTTYSRSTGTNRSNTEPTWGAIFSGATMQTASTTNGTSSTSTETGRRLIQAAEVLRLHERTALILTKNMPPIFARQARYFEEPELEALVAPPARDHEGPPTAIRATAAVHGTALPSPPPLPPKGAGAPARAKGAKARRPAPPLLSGVGRCKACGERIEVAAMPANGEGKCGACGTSFRLRPALKDR